MNNKQKSHASNIFLRKKYCIPFDPKENFCAFLWKSFQFDCLASHMRRTHDISGFISVRWRQWMRTNAILVAIFVLSNRNNSLFFIHFSLFNNNHNHTSATSNFVFYVWMQWRAPRPFCYFCNLEFFLTFNSYFRRCSSHRQCQHLSFVVSSCFYVLI